MSEAVATERAAITQAALETSDGWFANALWRFA